MAGKAHNFNTLARNHDDHVKHIAFLNYKQGAWRLSPAFDRACSCNPDGTWTSRHRISLTGKRNDFRVEELVAFAQPADLKKAIRRLREEAGSFGYWRRLAKTVAVFSADMGRIENSLRLRLWP